MAIGRLTH